jgi:hypothetical protein
MLGFVAWYDHSSEGIQRATTLMVNCILPLNRIASSGILMVLESLTAFTFDPTIGWLLIDIDGVWFVKRRCGEPSYAWTNSQSRRQTRNTQKKTSCKLGHMSQSWATSPNLVGAELCIFGLAAQNA